VRHDQDAAVAAVTVAEDARSALLADLLGRVAGCFPRRETRQCCGQMVSGLLMELEDHNCWTIAEAPGHRGPHRLQHFLSRAVWDDQRVLDIASAWAVSHLDDGDAVLIVDETADEKSSTDAVGAARQYSGTVGGIALCQVAVTLTYTTGRGHALIGRALYLPEACAADEEHRELAGVPEEVMFASKPQPAGSLLDRAHSRRIRAAFVAGDEVYGGRQLRRDIRQRGMGYVMAVRANHVVTTGSLSDIPHPHAAENDVIVRVYAAGFTPGELDWPGTWTDRAGRDRTPSVPGHELSGVVSELGYGTTGLTVGQRVFGLADWTRDGALAEYTAVEARNLAPLPADIDYAVAAAVPISGLTAWQGLFDHAGLKTGQTVLIHGAAGGVGSMAVQLAHELGSRVIGTGRAADREAALGLGADVFVDLQADRLEEVGEVDVVFDVIGGEVLERSAPLVRAGGTLVTIIGPPQVRPADGRAIFFVVEPDRLRRRTSPSGCGPGGCSRSSGPYGRWPRRRPRSRPTAGCPARRSSASRKANNGRRVSDRWADRSPGDLL